MGNDWHELFRKVQTISETHVKRNTAGITKKVLQLDSNEKLMNISAPRLEKHRRELKQGFLTRF